MNKWCLSSSVCQQCCVWFLTVTHLSQTPLNLGWHQRSFHPRQWSAQLWRFPVARWQNTFTVHFHFIHEAFSSGTNHTGRCVSQHSLHDQLAMTILSSLTEVPQTEQKNVPWLMQCWSVICRCLAQMKLRISAHPQLQKLNTCFPVHNLTKSHSRESTDKSHTHTGSKTADHNLRHVRPLSSPFSVCGCPCALLSFQTRSNDFLIVARETGVAFFRLRTACLADENTKQARDRETKELLWYSQTKRPWKAKGFSVLLQAKQHFKSFYNLFIFRRTDPSYTGTLKRKCSRYIYIYLTYWALNCVVCCQYAKRGHQTAIVPVN